MTLPRLYAMNRYWQDHPPVHILLAAFMGMKPTDKMEAEEAGLDELLQAFGGAGLVEGK